MVKEEKRKGYDGVKATGDTKEYREARRQRAEKNAADVITNEVFASSDSNFRDLCEKAGVKPTKRQASKFRNNYGKAAYQNNTSKRKVSM